MNSLPPIPTPRGQRWREFRLRFIPLLVFSFALVVAANLWRQIAVSPTMVGEVEPIQVEVRSPDSCMLTNLFVRLFEEVKMGDPIALLDTSDPRTSTARLNLIQGRMDLLRLERENPQLDQQRNDLDLERIRLDLQNQKIALATAQINFQRVSNDFQRVNELFREKVVSEKVFDLAEKTKEVLEIEVKQRYSLVADLSESVIDLDNRIAKSREITQFQNLAVQSNRLAIAQSATNLLMTAPMDGVVSMIRRRAGEMLQPGDPIVSIRSKKSERIISYLRQPLLVEPREGMQVQVRTRSLLREEGWARILNVGSQMEPISAPLLRLGMQMELGLPFAVSLPLNLKVRPGELVDLIIHPNLDRLPQIAFRDGIVLTTSNPR